MHCPAAALVLWEAVGVEAEQVVLPTGGSTDDVIAQLYHEQYRTLVGLAGLLVDQHGEAEEVVQDAFVRLYASWGKLRDPSRASFYLRTTVLNLARGRLRRRRVARRHPELPGPDAPPADEVTVAPDTRSAVITAVRALPRRQQDCVLLRYYGGCNEHEVAASLGISPGSVKTHLHRAMAALSSTLDGFK